MNKYTFKITVTIEDDKGRKSRLVFYMTYYWTGLLLSNPLAVLTGRLDVILAQLDTIILGQIRGCSIQLDHTLPAGLRATPDPSSDVEEKLTVQFNFESMTSLRPFRHLVPTINENAIITVDGVNVWQDFDLWYVDDMTDADQQYIRASDNHGNLLSGWSEAWLSFKRR